MLIGAGQEMDVIAIQPLKPGKRIAGKRCVGMADMRVIIDVINWRRDVKRLISGHSASS